MPEGATFSPKLILASASPRRRELLGRVGLEFDVRPVDIVEAAGPGRDPQIIARHLAREKAEAARLLYQDSIIIAADTVVWDGGQLGKPETVSEARAMLRQLSGRVHEVVTAVTVMRSGGTAVLARHPVTRVRLRELDDDEIEASIRRGDPFDKAGAYAIQDEALHPVASYEGCYCNVVGLPLLAVIELLQRCDVPVDRARARLLPQCTSCPLSRR